MTALRSPQSDRWLNLPLELRDEGAANSARTVTYIIIAALAILAVWAAVAPIEEVSVAAGKMVPAAPVSEVNHLEGGIVEDVLVREGEHVREGQVLLRLRPEQAVSDLSQIEARIAGLQLKSTRLAASLIEEEPDFGALGEQYPKLRDEQKLAFQQDIGHAREERHQLQLAVARISEQLGSAEREAKSLVVQVDLHEKQTDIREKSNAMGYTSLHNLLQARTSLEETRQRLIAANGRVGELSRLREEAQTKLREAVAERLRKLAEDRADTGAQLGEAEGLRAKYRDRVSRLEIKAPIDGIIQALGYNVGGEVVKPGGAIAQIIPGADGVLAEVELEPRDIGHVRVGNDADIRMSNYDPKALGAIHGKVQLISATTFETRDGRPFYRVRIALDGERVPGPGSDLPILPGMTLQAQIVTGSKSLLRYMLKPIYQSLDTAFAER